MHEGPHEDYMINTSQWGSPQFIENWESFNRDWGLNDLNECVNFYFEVENNTIPCDECDGSGWHKESLPIVNSFYSSMNEEGYVWDSPNEMPIKIGYCCFPYHRTQMEWHDKITDDEVQALIDHKRLFNFDDDDVIPNAKSINEAEKTGLGHDAINRIILTNARIKRLGLKQHCDKCDGSGEILINDVPLVKLVLWMLHPRKGCSRGVEIYNITENDLPSIHNWLKTARERNFERFNKLDMICPAQLLLE